MEFKNLANDPLALMAELVRREATERDPQLAAALRTIEIIEHGRYGEARPDVRVTVALAKGLEVAINECWSRQDTPLANLVADASGIVDTAERIFDDRDCTADMFREVRSALSREVAKAKRRGLPYRTLAVSLTSIDCGTDDLPAVRISLEVIGPMLDLEPVQFAAETAEDLVRGFAEVREKQEQRLVLRSRLAELGADIIIDAPTLAVLQDAGIDLPDTIAKLRREECGIIDVEVRHGRLVLYVSNGVVTGNAPLGGGMRWQEGKLIAPKSSGIIAARAEGKLLNRLTSTNYFAADVSVVSASAFGEVVWLHARPAPVALALDTPLRAVA